MKREDAESEEIDAAVFRMVKARLKQRNATLIAPENEFNYAHGETWVHVSAEQEQRNEGIFAEHSTETLVPMKGFIENDIAIVPRFVEEMAEKMHGEFARSIFSMVGEAAASVGNSISIRTDTSLDDETRGRSLRKSMGEMMQRIQLGVNQYGRPTYPTLHIGPDNKELIAAINLPETEEERRETDDLLRTKESEAVGREAERLSRYRRP